MEIDRDEIVRLTREYGGEWGFQHVCRILRLVEEIGVDLDFDHEVVWLAAHLHDWGAWSPWAQADVPHTLRSRQVADEFLTERHYPAAKKMLVLDCVERHDAPGPDDALEVKLLRDADSLDSIGVVGVLRGFCKEELDLRRAFSETKRRRGKALSIIILPQARQIAARRVAEMDEILRQFEGETFGCF